MILRVDLKEGGPQKVGGIGTLNQANWWAQNGGG